MSNDLEYYKQSLGNNPENSALNAYRVKRADRIAQGLAKTGISEEEKAQLKKEKSQLMSTIQYKGIDFSDDKPGLFLKP